MTAPPAHAKTIFLDALEIPAPAARQRFLDKMCGTDPQLRAEVEDLLRFHEQIPAFSPSAVVSPTVEIPKETAPTAASSTQIGPYTLREVLGEGGMGIVYAAEQETPIRRKVALKVIKPGMDTREVIARFEAERQALALMDHPHITKIIDAGTTSEPDASATAFSANHEKTPVADASGLVGRPYFVMELVRGLPITDYCDQAKLNLRERLKLFITVCQAVQHAHQKGIIHRDLKPSNVMITLHDGTPVPKIIDFGVAKALNQRLTEQTLYTRVNSLVGTPMYMSPEQAELSGLDIDTRSDVYSLGVLLYELLTGHTPFDKDVFSKVGYDEFRRIIREDEPPRPSQRVSTLGMAGISTVAGRRKIDERQLTKSLRGELDWIVMKSLEKDRNRRYESASAFAADVERFLNDEPVKACPPSTGYRLVKTFRRYRIAATAIAIVASAILASSAFSAWKYVDEREARQDADVQKTIALANAEQAEQHAVAANRERNEAQHQRDEAQRQRDLARQNLYFADMGLAFVDIAAGNIGRAERTLLSHVPRRGEPDQRSWEWHYLLGQIREAECTIYRHQDQIWEVAWSPDGKYLASNSLDGTTRVWDTATWNLLRTFDHGPSFHLALAWSPDSGKLAWGTASEAALRIWDRETDAICVLMGYPASIWAITWSHDGQRIATGSIHEASRQPKLAGNVRVWDVEKQESVAEFTTKNHANSLSWSSDDQLLAAGTAGVLFCNTTAGTSSEEAELSEGRCAAWHPTEMRLAVGTKHGECLIWDQKTRKLIQRWTAHQDDVIDIEWSPHGEAFLSASSDGTVKVWSVSDGRELRSIAAHAGRAKSVTWEPSCKRFASGGSDHAVRIWNVDPRPSLRTIHSKFDGEVDLTWDAESRSLLLNSVSAGKIVAFDIQTGNELEEFPLALDETQRLASFRYVVNRSFSVPNTSSLIQVSSAPRTGALATMVAPSRYNAGHPQIVLAPDESKLAFFASREQGWGSRILIHDIRSQRTVQGAEFLGQSGLAWSPDSRQLAVVGNSHPEAAGYLDYSGFLHLIDSETGERSHLLRIGTERVAATAVAWSHDGRRIAVGNREGLCEIWDWRAEHKLVSERIHSTRVNDLAWSDDDRLIASGGLDQRVLLWDSKTGHQIAALEPHSAKIRRICWSPDGQKLAALSQDGVIKVWNASAGYSLLLTDEWRHYIELLDWKEFHRLIDEEQWSDAGDLLQEMVAYGSVNEDAYFRLALVNLQLDDEAAYRQACQRMLAAFAKSKERRDAYFTAWACALRPAALADYGTAIALAQHAYHLDFRARENAHRARAAQVLGAILFRAGRYEEALKHLQAANDTDWKAGTSSARIAYLLAMTHHRLSRAADSRMWLVRGNEEAEKERKNTLEPSTWEDRLILDLFQREANELTLQRTFLSRRAAG